MKQFLTSSAVLLAVPMLALNPMGRPAFLGYYLGVITMWFVFVCAGQIRESRESRSPSSN